MGVVQLSDELQRVIERQVAEGRAASPAAFLEEAVMRLVDEAGSADITAGRFTTVATAEDEERLRDGMMARLRSRLSAEG